MKVHFELNYLYLPTLLSHPHLHLKNDPGCIMENLPAPYVTDYGIHPGLMKF